MCRHPANVPMVPGDDGDDTLIWDRADTRYDGSVQAIPTKIFPPLTCLLDKSFGPFLRL